MPKRKTVIQDSAKRPRPALTPEARDSQLISHTYNLVEQRLLDGTASSQETVYFLKLASKETRLKEERAVLENELIKAKTQALKSQERIEELYANAIKAMSRYNGQHEDYEDEDDDYDDY